MTKKLFCHKLERWPEAKRSPESLYCPKIHVFVVIMIIPNLWIKKNVWIHQQVSLSTTKCNIPMVINHKHLNTFLKVMCLWIKQLSHLSCVYYTTLNLSRTVCNVVGNMIHHDKSYNIILHSYNTYQFEWYILIVFIIIDLGYI